MTRRAYTMTAFIAVMIVLGILIAFLVTSYQNSQAEKEVDAIYQILSDTRDNAKNAFHNLTVVEHKKPEKMSIKDFVTTSGKNWRYRHDHWGDYYAVKEGSGHKWQRPAYIQFIASNNGKALPESKTFMRLVVQCSKFDSKRIIKACENKFGTEDMATKNKIKSEKYVGEKAIKTELQGVQNFYKEIIFEINYRR